MFCLIILLPFLYHAKNALFFNEFFGLRWAFELKSVQFEAELFSGPNFLELCNIVRNI